MKVQNLARELRKTTRELISELQRMGISVKSGNTKLENEEIEFIKKTLFNKTNKDAIREAEYDLLLTDASITIQDLAKKIKVTLPEIMKAVLTIGMQLNLNSEISANTAKEIAESCGVELILELDESNSKITDIKTNLDKIEEQELNGDLEQLITRPPVVTIMGHVDHGKTALLDVIRKSNIVAKEFGGITQHIGAYQVKVKNKKITFLDTPGHAAFTTLRARGTQVTDIAILVVAADEGIKPQTVEAINHAIAANVEVIVAINKIDKPEANIDNVKQQLTQYNLVAEEWGGKTIMLPVSAKTKQGVPELLDMIQLIGDMKELKANPQGKAKGVVIESKLSKSKGPIATVLVKSGTLKVGDVFIAGQVVGKIRALLNDLGEKVKTAPPSMPVEILGISEVPQPGDILEVVGNEKIAREIVEKRKLLDKDNRNQQKISFESLSQEIGEGHIKKLNIIVKADVHGSLEAIIKLVQEIKSKDVQINIIHSATGPVNENDIMLAKASQAIIIGFGNDASPDIFKIAENEGIEIKLYKIIYQIIDDLVKVTEGMFKKEYIEVETARLEIRELFKFSKVGTIAGCFVTSGKINRNSIIVVEREKKEIFKGKLSSLKRFKEDVKEVQQGFECGIVVDGFQDLKPGDTVICFEIREKERTL